MIKIIAESHVHDGISDTVLGYVARQEETPGQVTVRTIVLPAHVDSVPCGLHGPIMGDAPIDEWEVHYGTRGDRPTASRLVDRPVRRVRTVTYVCGPYGTEPCVLYTIYGGPSAPREVADLEADERHHRLPKDGEPGFVSLDLIAARTFWKLHALSPEG